MPWRNRCNSHNRNRQRNRNRRRRFRCRGTGSTPTPRASAWRLAEQAGPASCGAIVYVTRRAAGAAAIAERGFGIRLIETVCVASYNHVTQGELKVLKDVARSPSSASAAAAARAC